MPKEETIVEEKQPVDLIDDANKAADRLKRENDRKEALLLREEKLAIQNTLSGKSDAGEVEEVEESPQEYKDRVIRGEV